MTETLTKYWFLVDFNLFQKVGMKAMMEISEELVMHRYPKGTRIELACSDKQSVFFLKKGSVKIVSSSSEMVKFILGPGNVFGELGLYEHDGAVDEAAHTLEESVVCIFSAEQMNAMIEKHKSLKNKILKVYGLRYRRLERRLEDLVNKDSTTRIEEYIYEYITSFGKLVNGRLEAKRLLSHTDIAHLTSTSRQTVNNVLVKLRQEGSLDYNTKIISMPNPQE